MAKSLHDLFRYPDGLLTSDKWFVVVGPPWVEDNAIQLSATSDQAIGLWHEQMDSLEHMARCSFRITRASANAYAALLVRAELAEEGSPSFIRRTYMVQVTGDGNVRVFSIIMGEAAPRLLGSCNLPGLEIGTAHLLVVKVLDRKPVGAVISVHLDDEVAPVLTVRDTWTERPKGKYVGWDFADSDGQQSVILSEFYAHVSRSSVVRNPEPVPYLKNFGDLKYEMRFRMDRAGNSQFDDTVAGAYINYALNEVYNAGPLWEWAKAALEFTTTGEQFYPVPVYVAYIYGLQDITNNRLLRQVEYRDLQRMNPDGSGSGPSSCYATTREGDLAALTVVFPRPPAGSYRMWLPYYRKPVPMVEDTDIPFLPPEWNEILLFGGLKRGAQYSDAKTLWATNAQEFKDMLARMVRANNTYADKFLRLATANQHVGAQGRSGSGPLTRREQLGY